MKCETWSQSSGHVDTDADPPTERIPADEEQPTCGGIFPGEENEAPPAEFQSERVIARVHGCESDGFVDSLGRWDLSCWIEPLHSCGQNELRRVSWPALSSSPGADLIDGSVQVLTLGEGLFVSNVEDVEDPCAN